MLRRRGRSIDCIISDWNMRPVNGLELLREVRKGGIADVPANTTFIMLTGYATSAVVTTAANLDVSAYLVKPVSSNRLAEAVRLSLQKPFTAKPASHYERIELLELPGTVDSPDTTTTPWAEWIKAGRPVILADQGAFIRRQSVELREAPPAAAADIRLIRHKRVDRILPGAILVEDFCDADGAVLLSAGLVLNENILRRLRDYKTANGGILRLWVGRA